MAEQNGFMPLGGVDMAAFSVVSDNRPERNEDAYFIDAENRAAGVCDGVSGNKDYGSAEAARLAATEISEHLAKTSPVVSRILSHRVMREAVLAGHHAILDAPTDGATTAVAAKIFENDSAPPFAAVASAGDSRAYLLRECALTHLTVDDSYSTAYYGQEIGRQLQETLANTVTLPEKDTALMEAFRSQGIITSFLGMQKYPPVVAVSDFEVKNKDKIVLTSDGIPDNLTTDEIRAIVAEQATADEIAQMLVSAAQNRSRDTDHHRAKPDDMTAVVLVVG